MWLYHIVYECRSVRWFLRALAVWLVVQPALLFAESEGVTDLSAAPSETTMSKVEPQSDALVATESVVAPGSPEIASDEGSSEATPPDGAAAELPPPTPERTNEGTVIDADASSTVPVRDGTNVYTATSTQTDSGQSDENHASSSGASSETVLDTSTTSTTSTGATGTVSTSERSTPPATSTTTSQTPVDTALSPANAAGADEQNSAATTTPVLETTNTGADSPAVATHTVTTNDSFFQFSQDECVQVKDGSFYCGATTAQAPAEDRFFVALDADGDREIFAQQDGETVQITHNRYDDAAPYYDAISNTLVWHALMDGRYQIMSYDFSTETEQQLTSGTANSMEPTRYGSVTAWQQWGASSWDIVLTDGDEERRITNDTISDIAPSVHDGFVIWKRVFESGQRVALYDIAQERIIDVSESESSATVSNARMMLVFESVQANGDRVVQGFDPVTRQIMPLQAESAPVPEELPDSEPTDEVRALVQAKPVTEEELTDTDMVGNTAASSSGSTASTTAAVRASTTHDLVIAPTGGTEERVVPATPVSTSTASSTAEPVTVASTTYDLVIPPVATTTEE